MSNQFKISEESTHVTKWTFFLIIHSYNIRLLWIDLNMWYMNSFMKSILDKIIRNFIHCLNNRMRLALNVQYVLTYTTYQWRKRKSINPIKAAFSESLRTSYFVICNMICTLVNLCIVLMLHYAIVALFLSYSFYCFRSSFNAISAIKLQCLNFEE